MGRHDQPIAQMRDPAYGPRFTATWRAASLGLRCRRICEVGHGNRYKVTAPLDSIAADRSVSVLIVPGLANNFAAACERSVPPLTKSYAQYRIRRQADVSKARTLRSNPADVYDRRRLSVEAGSGAGSNAVAALPSADASHSSSSSSLYGRRPLAPTKKSRNLFLMRFSARSFSLMAASRSAQKISSISRPVVTSLPSAFCC